MHTPKIQTILSASLFRRSTAFLGESAVGAWRMLVLVGLLTAAHPAYAANRELKIDAPTSAVTGGKITIVITASTDAGDGEQIGLFHADYSTNSGASWTAISYATDAGPTTTRSATFRVGMAGSKAIVRVRVAFRGGKAGEVDFSGKRISWETTWSKWQEPPAKVVKISVVDGVDNPVR